MLAEDFDQVKSNAPVRTCQFSIVIESVCCRYLTNNQSSSGGHPRPIRRGSVAGEEAEGVMASSIKIH